jgi:DNA-binding transcriptional LysR family regulator
MSVPDLDMRLLQSFLAVAEELHFGRAARRLHLSQPPLSMQIRKLEERLGVRLFERSRRHVELTEAGVVLVLRARHLIAEAERAQRELLRVARGESGVLSVGYTPSTTYDVLPRLVQRLRRSRPEIKLELVELRSSEQVSALQAGRIELGFVCGPLAPPDLIERVVLRERPVVAMPARHALAKRKWVTVQALRAEPFVQVRREIEPAWAEPCAHALRVLGVGGNVAQETDSKLAMLGLVAARVGVCVVPESMARLGRHGVVFRPVRGLSLRFSQTVLTRPRPSPRTKALLSLL